MLLVIALGQQHVHVLPQQFLAAVAEQPLGLAVDQDDPALLVHDHGAVRGGLQQAAQPGVGSLPLTGIQDGRFLLTDQLLLDIQIRFADRSQRDVDELVHAIHGGHEAFWGIPVGRQQERAHMLAEIADENEPCMEAEPCLRIVPALASQALQVGLPFAFVDGALLYLSRQALLLLGCLPSVRLENGLEFGVLFDVPDELRPDFCAMCVVDAPIVLQALLLVGRQAGRGTARWVFVVPV